MHPLPILFLRRLFRLPLLREIGLCIFCVFFLYGGQGLATIRDGGVDPNNLGKGEWIYYVSQATNHMSDSGGGVSRVASVTNIPSLMSFLNTNLHLQFVVVKAGNGDDVFPSAASPQFTSTLVNAAHAQGLKIFGYTRSFGTNLPGELSIVSNVFNAGGDGFIFDAEGEWVTNLGNKAASNAWWLCSTFRTNWPNKFLAHAPAADIQYRYGNPPSFPYKEFGYWCDVAMPQDYWNSWGMNSNANVNKYGTPAKGIEWMDSSYTIWENSLAALGNTPNGDSWTNAIKPLAPIASADDPGGTNIFGIPTQTFADITNWVYLLKTDTNVPALGGYKGCCFFRIGLQDTNNLLAGIAAATIGNPTNTPPPVIVSDIIVDNLDAGFSTTGSWSVNSTSSDKWDADYRYATATSGAATAIATWTPTILTAGNYDVSVWYPDGTNRTTNAPYTVLFNGGTASSNVNQRVNGGSWWVIASGKNFLKGTFGSVQLGNNASTNVVMADAIKFSYSTVQPSPTMSFNSISRLPDGRVRVQALSNRTNFIIEGSSNLVNWQTLTNGTISSNAVDYTDPVTNGIRRFYRGQVEP
ncbi:MAG: hypothetical protein JWM68_1992 [Verrucomicrobiales bacterium]|nr:hypothetical protein [Verrucomicrobiales bacterium]